MIDRQSLLNNPNVQWQSAEPKKTNFSLYNTEQDQLRRAATARVDEIVNATEFIGWGGAKINIDGSYEVLARTGSDLVDDKLKEILHKSFEEDEELNSILGKLRDLHSTTKDSQAETTGELDTFERSDSQPIPKWQEQYNNKRAIKEITYGALSPTATPILDHDGALKAVEDWITKGGPFPNFPKYH